MSHRQSRSQILIIDDDIEGSGALARSIQAREPSTTITLAHTPDAAREAAKHRPPAIILLDLSLHSDLGPESGLSLIPELGELSFPTRIYVITGHYDDQWGLRSIQAGASSFLAKPVDIEHLLALIRDGLAYAAICDRQSEVVFTPAAAYPSLELHSHNQAMQRALERAAFAATTDQSVLILGETGTGKGVLAQRICRANHRRRLPLIRFQPSYGSFDLISSELFGHERGAFTGAVESRRGLLEEAHGGTLFIDEVDELPHQTQVSLLHALQEHTFRRVGSNRESRSDFRLLTATNRPIASLLTEGKLRRDFYHRIAHLVIELPPLRERKEDLEDLFRGCLTTPSAFRRPRFELIAPEAWNTLLQYDWPGNIREFQAVVSSAGALARYRKHLRIEVADIELRGDNASPTIEAQQPSNVSLREQVRAFEEQLARRALAQTNNNQSAAAHRLGLDRSSFRRIIARSER